MYAIVSSCVCSLDSLQKLKEAIQPDTWADCVRLCNRTQIFDALLNELKNFPHMLTDIEAEEQVLLTDLEKTLIGVEAFVADFVTRTSFKGMTESSFRNGSSADFAKLNQQIFRFASDLNIPTEGLFDQIRQEDLEDQRKSFLFAFLNVVEEMGKNNEFYVDQSVEALLQDIESYPSQIAKFLAANKHMGLTVSETKALKADVESMKTILENKVAEPPKMASAQDSPLQTSGENSLDTPNSEKDCSFDPELVAKIVHGDSLNSDEKNQKKKLLNDLKLSVDDVSISRIRIGQGGFGDVYLGTFRRKYKVAVKTIRNMDDPYAENKKKSIENELLLMKFLGSYPTILSCYGYVAKDDSLQIVLELAPYGSLDHMIRDKTNFQNFPLSLMVAWLCDLADAIKFLHSREIKHRDIKAENMLVFERFRIKLCDFGPAKQHLANVTAESKVGTFCFMAPEIRVGHVSEFASDIFSFAMTAIQILTRKTPKIDDFVGQILETIKQLQFSDASVGESLHELLTACVQYDPEVHPNVLRPSAEQVCNELNDLMVIFGGDPRDEEDETIKAIETIAQKKESDRMKSISRSGSMFRPQTGSLSRKNSPAIMNTMTFSNDLIGKQESIDNITIYTAQTNQGPLSPPSMGMQQLPHTNSANSLFAMSFGSQDVEDKSSFSKFFLSTLNCSQTDANLVADMLIKNGVANLDILRRRLTRNEEFLLDLGVEDQLADDIYEEVIIKSGKGANHSSSSVMSPRSVGSAKSMKRRNALLPFNEVLPTEVSRLYYDAAQLNKTEALDLLKEYVEKGDKLAECFVMRMYALGQGGIKKDIDRAQEMGERLLPWLKDAIDSGNDMYLMYVRYLMGVCYAEGLGTKQDMREAVRWCKQSAEQGYAAAQAYLGFCYFSGIGVPRNLEEAVRWYRLGADQGYAPAQCNLGLCYEHGYGVPINPEHAIKWYRLSADQGDAAALFNLGYCYEKGVGVVEDMKDAVRFYKLSAGYGYTAAQYNLGVCFYFGTGVEQDMEEAVTWYRIAADKGYAPAQCNLGLCYENGHGIEKDYVEAVYWYRQSADQGHPAALYYLGFCYFSGMGVSKNIEEAVRFYKLSAEKKYAPALNNLGFCYFNGLGVPKNYTMAVKYYRASAELGYAPAQYNMGYCYEKGYGVVSKLQSIIRWYRLAAENGNEKAQKALQRFQT